MLRTPQHLRRNRWPLIISIFFAAGWLMFAFDWNSAAGRVPAPAPEPTPTIDRLATPVLPASPQPRDFGQQVYYLNCMPCHGDVGQGLTDEWRAVWEEDHRDCWASGCHGGRAGDEGFPVPRTIPAVIGAPPVLGNFHTSEDLFEYLKQTHPPQRPGALSDTDYHNVTALLWEASGRPTLEPTQPASEIVQPTPEATPPAPDAQPAPMLDLPIVGGALMLVALLFVVIRRRRVA